MGIYLWVLLLDGYSNNNQWFFAILLDWGYLFYILPGYCISKWTHVDLCWAMSLKGGQLSAKIYETWEGRLFHGRDGLSAGLLIASVSPLFT